MEKKDKYTNKELIKKLDNIEKCLTKDVKIVYKNRTMAYLIALCFLFGFSVLFFGIALNNNWDLKIAVGGSLVVLGFFLMWANSEGDL